MNHISIHIIQTFPVSCLNRDDFNQPKVMTFGGVQRSRISSQCYKRAISTLLKESDYSKYFQGTRSRWFIPQLVTRLVARGVSDPLSLSLATCVGGYLGTKDSNEAERTKTVLFMSPSELDTIAEYLVGLSPEDRETLTTAPEPEAAEEDGAEGGEEEAPKVSSKGGKGKGGKGKGKKDKKKMDKGSKKILEALWKALGKAPPSDAVNIALNGRMIASEGSLSVEAAAEFNHAFSVHASNNEVDFFTAVDDIKPKEGAGITGSLDFNSATYYRYAGLNLDTLFDKDHLSYLKPDERKAVVRSFLWAVLRAVPSARRATMFANSVPDYVLVSVYDKGKPIQLAGAFETPVSSKQGHVSKAIELLKAESQKLRDNWGIVPKFEVSIPEVPFDKLLDLVSEEVCKLLT